MLAYKWCTAINVLSYLNLRTTQQPGIMPFYGWSPTARRQQSWGTNWEYLIPKPIVANTTLSLGLLQCLTQIQQEVILCGRNYVLLLRDDSLARWWFKSPCRSDIDKWVLFGQEKINPYYCLKSYQYLNTEIFPIDSQVFCVLGKTQKSSNIGPSWQSSFETNNTCPLIQSTLHP